MPDPERTAEAEVEKLFRHWAELEVKKDLDAWLELVADDVILQPAGEPAVRGKNAARDWFINFFQTPVSLMEPGHLTVFVSESQDLACNYGDLTVVVDSPDGKVEGAMKSMVVWRKIDGSWKVAANSWSANSPG